MRMRIVLVPTWVEQALTAAKKPLPTLLDAVALSSTLSKEDVANYIDLNDRLLEKLLRPVWESFDVAMLYPYNPKTAPAPGSMLLSELQDYLSRKLSEIRMEYPNGQPVYRLFDQHPQFDSNDNTDALVKITFEAFHIDDDVIGIRPVMYKNDEPMIAEDIRAYDGLLKIMNIYTPLEELSLTPAFNQYTSLLAMH